MDKYFFCYSKRLRKALIENGFIPICNALNKRTKAEFWLFVGDAELNKYKNETYQEDRDRF